MDRLLEPRGGNPKGAVGRRLVAQDAAGGIQRAVDMADRAVPQAVGIGVVFFSRDIRARLPQILQGLVNAAGTIRTLISRRVKVQVLAIVDRRLLDVVDARVDLPYGLGL